LALTVPSSSDSDETVARPLFSVLMPAYETPPDLLEQAIRSVVDQTFSDWELVVVDDGSPNDDVRAVMTRITDPRIRMVRRETNGGIVAASNDGLAVCAGEYLALMDHDDLLDPAALATCAETLSMNPTCDFLYSDEDWIDMDGARLGSFWKPDWSPERLRSQQYVNHLSVYRRRLVVDLGGFRVGFDGSQDYDLVLRVTEQARLILHVPKVLYHWRVRPGQVSSTGNPAVYAAARRAIEEHCQRIGIRGHVEQIDPLGVYRVRRHLDTTPLVSLVIPTRGSSGTVGGIERIFVTEAVRSIVSQSTYPSIEFVVVADRDTPSAVIDELAELAGDRLMLVWYDGPFNFAHKINVGVTAATGTYVLLLNDDVEVITPDWIETMVGIAQQRDVGMVGATLLFEDDTLQHAGHIYAGEGAIGHIAYGQPADSDGPVMALKTERECSGVTAACALLSRRLFFEIGGLSRQFPVNYNDVDLSMKLRSKDFRIVVTPFARLHHFESKTRRIGVGRSEQALIRNRWGRYLRGGEPFWRYP
jgi:glycosyltransferase involved in cell wall biosynthesis